MFNILGPLINPARATNQLIGVFSPEWTSVLARVLHNLGTEHVLVVHGEDGLDEVTTTGKTKVSEVNNGAFSEYEISPEEFGLKRARIEDLAGGLVSENIFTVMEILKGRKGPTRDIILLNAACAIYAANKAASIKEGLALAQESIDSGRALQKLELLKEYSRR
jgi:anthranilate phosphoribosyltransferase